MGQNSNTCESHFCKTAFVKLMEIDTWAPKKLTDEQTDAGYNNLSYLWFQHESAKNVHKQVFYKRT